MILTIQILTIIVDVLLILFLLGIVAVIFAILGTIRKMGKTIDNFSNIHFWMSSFKSIFKGCKKNKC